MWHSFLMALLVQKWMHDAAAFGAHLLTSRPCSLVLHSGLFSERMCQVAGSSTHTRLLYSYPFPVRIVAHSTTDINPASRIESRSQTMSA